jgi:acyl-CoA synthetase (AMP-forming)/AMP-acid ligase II
MLGSDYNIAAHLPRMAALQPDTPALHIPQPKRRSASLDYTSYSYQQLDQISNRMAAVLEQVGISEAVRTVLMVTPSLEFFALTFALFKVGAIPILVDPGMGVKNLKVCLEEAQPQAFIGIPKAQLARMLFGWGRGSLETIVHVGTKLGRGHRLARLVKRQQSDSFDCVPRKKSDMAAILFTSGSTGVPKGAVYTHGNFVAQVEALKQVYGIEPGEIDLPTFPLFALFAPALGMTSVIPLMDFTRPGSVDPEQIIEPIKRFSATTMFGSPALIHRVGLYGQEKDVRLPTLKRVISAGAPVPATTLQRFSGMLRQEVEIFTPYGATESLPVCSIGSHEILRETSGLTDHGRGVCIGRPVASIDLKVIAISDEPIPEWTDALVVADGEIGEIAVRGEQVTRSYFNRDASTALAKIACADGGFYHRMGDLGYRDEQGRIWFCGRKAHRVLTTDKTFFSIPCEAIFNVHPQVFRTALVPVRGASGIKPLICVELQEGVAAEDHAGILSELMTSAVMHQTTGGIQDFLIHPAFPVDIRHNAKIFREKLAVWAEEQSQ